MNPAGIGPFDVESQRFDVVKRWFDGEMRSFDGEMRSFDAIKRWFDIRRQQALGGGGQGEWLANPCDLMRGCVEYMGRIKLLA